MGNDTDFTTAGTTGNVDPAYLELLGSGIDETDEATRDIGPEPVERCDFYVGKFEGATAGHTQKSGAPFVRPTFRITAGPQGTVGRFVSDDIYFTLLETVTERGKDGTETKRPATNAEKAENSEKKRRLLKRLANQLGLDRTVPASFTDEGLKAYAAGFAGKEAVLAIRIEKARGDFPAKNRIVWQSIAAPTSPSSKPNGKYATALDEALAQIERINAKKANGSGSGTVAGLGSSKATDF